MMGSTESARGLRIVSRKEDNDLLGALVSSAVKGDADAREVLAELCLTSVRKTVLWAYGTGNDCDDLCQIAMIKIFAGLLKAPQDADFFVWANRVTINVVHDYFRSRWNWFARYDADIDEKFACPVACNPEEEAHRTLLLRHIAACFQKLKPKLRLVLVLSMLHGYSSTEIAVMLDISFAAAKKRLERAEQWMMKQLRRDPFCMEALEEIGR